MDTITIQFSIEYMIIISIILVIILSLLIGIISREIRYKRIIKFFTRYGYVREFLGPDLQDSDRFFGWVRTYPSGYRDVVDDRDIRNKSMRQIRIDYR